MRNIDLQVVRFRVSDLSTNLYMVKFEDAQFVHQPSMVKYPRMYNDIIMWPSTNNQQLILMYNFVYAKMEGCTMVDDSY